MKSQQELVNEAYAAILSDIDDEPNELGKLFQDLKQSISENQKFLNYASQRIDEHSKFFEEFRKQTYQAGNGDTSGQHADTANSTPRSSRS